MNEIKTHDTMSPEAQRIKIAEACGWKFIADYCHGEDQPPEYTTVTPDGRHLCGHYPDYLNDLNACREFEIWLLKNHPDLRAVYRRILIECVGSDGHYWMATAAQRAEAFLRTINKWVSASLKQ